MRHVIIGTNTLIGASIVRVLESIGGQEIVSCNPNGDEPEGVTGKNIQIEKADNLDPYSLMEILQKDDIVYNAQILENEDSDFDTSELHHNVGWINLLGIATHKKVRKIITYIPQLLGWKVSLNAVEDTIQENSSPYQLSLIEMINIAKKYWSGEDYGWSIDYSRDLAEAMVKNESLQNNELSNSKEKDPANPSVSSGPVPPNIGGPISPAGSPISSSSGPQPPSINGPQPPSFGSPGSPQEIDDEKKQVKKDEINEKEKEEEEERIPLVIARIARFFGSFDHYISQSFCQAVRLQRISIVGKVKNPISWCNPVDGGRSMIIMGDKKIQDGQYFINGFNATPIDILRALDNVNHSTIKITHKPLIFAKMKYNFKKLINKIGLKQTLEYSKLVKLNNLQQFNDQNARESWGWKERWDLESTTKETLNWYVNHVL